MLAVAGDDADLALPAFQRANQRAGDALFIEGLGIFAPSAHGNYGFAFARDVFGAGQSGILQQIDILDMQLGGKILITVQQDLWRLAFRWRDRSN